MVKALYTGRTAPSAGTGTIICLGAGDEMQCGVGHFTRGLSDALERLAPGSRVDVSFTRTSGTLGEFWRALRGARSVTCNFPIVAWKRVILRPLLALALARLRGRRVVVMLHEWDSLHLARRLTYMPALLLAQRIVAFSPLVIRQLKADPVVGFLARRCVLAPLPPNIRAPEAITETPLRQRLIEAKRLGKLIVGHFGSIYPGKQPDAVLAIAAALKARGADPLLVFIGSFIRGTDRVEEEFYARIAALGLTDDVIVSGFVETDAELFGLFGQVDAFCYRLSEGFTARRASITAVAQSGKPIIVTAPADPHEFDHHPRLRDLIARGAIVFVPQHESEEAYADAVMTAARAGAAPGAFDVEGWWRDTAEAIYADLAL